MIIVPNKNILVADDPMLHDTRLAGEFTLYILKADANGKPIEDSCRQVAKFPNLILNQGLDRMATQTDYLNCAQVGTGNSTPAVGQTALDARVAGTSTAAPTGNASSAQGSSPYFGTATRCWDFALGAVVGNMAEVGVGWATTANLFSRALIVDGGGNPTTITVLADELLRLSYTLYTYPVEADTSFNVTISGTNYTFVRRPSLVNQASRWANRGGAGSGSPGNIAEARRCGISNSTSCAVAHSGGIGAITGEPSGTPAGQTSLSYATYTNGSFYVDTTAVWGTGAANFGAGGIQSLSTELGYSNTTVTGGHGKYQYSVSPAFAKDNTKILTLVFRHTFTRR